MEFFKKKIIVMISGLAVTVCGYAQSVYPGSCAEKFKVKTDIPLAAESFDLQDVRLLPGRFRDNMMRDSAWMAWAISSFPVPVSPSINTVEEERAA